MCLPLWFSHYTAWEGQLSKTRFSRHLKEGRALTESCLKTRTESISDVSAAQHVRRVRSTPSSAFKASALDLTCFSLVMGCEVLHSRRTRAIIS